MTETAEQGQLVIENDRLKNTLTILNQKMKVQSDENSQLKERIGQLEEDLEAKDILLESKDTKIKSLTSSLDNSEDSRTQFQQDLEELNEKFIGLEEELFESKNIQLDLLE